MSKILFGKRLLKGENTLVSKYYKAIEWIKNNTIPEQGIIVSSGEKIPYLEVTGYLIPTLLDAGEFALAEQYAEFLSYMQRPNGSFAGPDGREYVFDSGQVLRGLVRASTYWERFRQPALKTSDYILSVMESSGRIPSIYKGDITEYVHIFILPALLEAGKLLNNSAYVEAARKSVAYYKSKSDVLDTCRLTHFLSYIIDGFLDMGESEFVRPAVERIFSSQKKNGTITGFPDVRWTCSTGLAQLAMIGYKMDKHKEADRAIEYLGKIQNASGGFYGSYGFRASYFRKNEISWANKFFIDALHLKLQSYCNRNSHLFSPDTLANDLRLRTVLDHLSNEKNKKLFISETRDGLFAKKIRSLFPHDKTYGIGLHEGHSVIPSEQTHRRMDNIFSLPYESETFDEVLCIGLLENTARIDLAINELCRVLRDKGRIIILNRNIMKLFKDEISDFERWHYKDGILEVLETYCSDIQVKEIISDGDILWSAIKNGGLDSDEWHQAMIGERAVPYLAEKIKKNQFPVWSKPLLKHTSLGDSMLELGSGTGELSAILSLYKRTPFLLDYSDKSIKYAKELFQELGLQGDFFCADVLSKIPIKNESIDWIWSSGLLEHFSDNQLLRILEESLRVCRKGIMSLVPNECSVFYRIGKHKMEMEESWQYGKEMPKSTMKNYFEAAGLRNIIEYSVGVYNSLNFWGSDKKDINNFFNSLSIQDIENLNQGYLLFTYGEK